MVLVIAIMNALGNKINIMMMMIIIIMLMLMMMIMMMMMMMNDDCDSEADDDNIVCLLRLVIFVYHMDCIFSHLGIFIFLGYCLSLDHPGLLYFVLTMGLARTTDSMIGL